MPEQQLCPVARSHPLLLLLLLEPVLLLLLLLLLLAPVLLAPQQWAKLLPLLLQQPRLDDKGV